MVTNMSGQTLHVGAVGRQEDDRSGRRVSADVSEGLPHQVKHQPGRILLSEVSYCVASVGSE